MGMIGVLLEIDSGIKIETIQLARRKQCNAACNTSGVQALGTDTHETTPQAYSSHPVDSEKYTHTPQNK